MESSRVSLLVRTELRRRARAARRDDQRFGFVLVMGPLVVLAAPFFIGWAFALGGQVAAGDTSGAIAVGETAPLSLFAYAAGIIAFRIVQSNHRSSALEESRLAAGHDTVVVGRLLVEVVIAFVLIGLPCLIGGVAFALGAGSPVTAVLVAVTALSIVALATVTGVAVGLGIETAIARSRVVARYRLPIAALAIVGYLSVVASTDESRLSGPILDALGATPLPWFGDLALLAVVPAADPVAAVAIVLATVGTLAVLTAGTVRLAALSWYSSPVRSATASRTLTPPSPRRLDRRTRRVVRKTWTRVIRSPLRLVYVGYAALLVGFLVANAIRHGWPSWLAPVVALFGAWGTGASVTLNPIGEEGPVLPATLTAPITGRRFVGALWIASAIPGVPITLAATCAVAVAAGFAPVGILLVGLFGAGLAAVSPGLAAGIGAVFPQTEPEAVTRNRAVVVPSFVAFGLYSLALFSVAVPGWRAIAGTGAIASGGGRSAVTEAAPGIGATLLLAGLVAAVSYRSASRRFDTYTLP